jgi:CRISPR-associated protein Cmr3
VVRLAEPDTLYRLRPMPASETVTDMTRDCPRLLGGAGEPAAGWCTGADLTRYLAGNLFEPFGGDLVAERDCVDVVDGAALFAREPRIGLARDRDRAARDGLLYQATHLRPDDGVAALVECVIPDEWQRLPEGPTPLGGRGRLADVSVVDGVGWPHRPDVFPDGRVLVYVATPAIWRTPWAAGPTQAAQLGWRFPVPEGADLVAAAVGEPQPVATASPREGMAATRALRWAVPAGSVYLLAFAGSTPAERALRALAWADRAHGTAEGMTVGRVPGDKLATAGYGVVLTGVWS